MQKFVSNAVKLARAKFLATTPTQQYDLAAKQNIQQSLMRSTLNGQEYLQSPRSRALQKPPYSLFIRFSKLNDLLSMLRILISKRSGICQQCNFNTVQAHTYHNVVHGFDYTNQFNRQECLLIAIAEGGAERIHQSLLVHQQECHGAYVEVKVWISLIPRPKCT